MAAPPAPDVVVAVDIDDVCARLKSGSTMAAIADTLSISTKTLQRRMREAGIDSRHDIRWTDEEVTEAVRELREDPGFEDTGVNFTHGTLGMGTTLACNNERKR